MRFGSFILTSILSGTSCAPSGSILSPVVVQQNERYDFFAELLKISAPRIDVEVIAALGKDYERINFNGFNGIALKKDVVRSLNSTGISRDSPYGNEVHRVTNVSQAKEILAQTWPSVDFNADSEIDLLFRKFHKASVALMECDHQRILFFDENDRLVAIYPEAGGGC